MLRRFVLATLFVLCAPSLGLAQSPSLRDMPVDVSADRLEVDQQRQEASFSVNVRVEQGTMRLAADKLTVFYADGSSEDGEVGGQAIRRIEAAGTAVTVIYGKDTATGKRAVYDVVQSEVVLDGGVVLVRGGNTLKGDKLVFNLATGKVSLLSAGNQRVRAQFTPKASNR